MPQRGRSLALRHVLKTDASWASVASYLRACEDCPLGKKDAGCGRLRDLRTRPADVAAWIDAAESASCVQDLRYARPRQVERHPLSHVLWRASYRHRLAGWAATRAGSGTLLHCDPKSVRQWTVELA